MKFANKMAFVLKAKAENKNILNTANNVQSTVEHAQQLNNAM